MILLKTTDMKRKRGIHPFNFGTVVIVAMSFVFMACSKDQTAEISASGKTLCFEIQSADDWQSLQRDRNSGDRSSKTAGVFPLHGENPADTLFLHATISDDAVVDGDVQETRARPVDKNTFYTSFGISAGVYVGTWDEKTSLTNYMFNVEVTKASNWATSYLWPAAGHHIRFFAYAPYNGTGIVLSDKTTPGTPSITYTVPASVGSQKDLLVAASGEISGNTTRAVPLKFKHVLTAVRFVSGDDVIEGTISKITLKGVYGSASYKMGASSWSGYGGTADFSQKLSVEIDGSANQEITTSAATFMMLPQTLPDGATVEVVYTDKLSSTQRTLTASIAGSRWPMGKIVTYRISTKSIDIVPTFEVSISDFTYKGGVGSCSVVSYATISRAGDASKKVAIPWTADFVQDNGNGTYSIIQKPDWLTDFTIQGSGGLTAAKYDVAVKAQVAEITNSHDETLQKAGSVGSEAERYGLDTNGGTTSQNTANCYVVNAPGKYKLPLIYGNGIKDGKINESAYFSGFQAQAQKILRYFSNYMGSSIMSPYIYNNDYGDDQCVVDDATLVWQDAANLVTNVTLSPDKTWLYFDVNASTIKQGNAVVAVRDKAKRIMWSWHIWVTDYRLGDNLKTLAGNSRNYQFMPIYLGWCYGTTYSYKERSVKVRFSQEETGESKVFTITQNPYTKTFVGNAPYYQWGRKDPMLPADNFKGVGDRSKTWYSSTGEESSSVLVGSWGNTRLLAETIKNPQVFYIQPGEDDPILPYLNLWSCKYDATSNNDETSIKTIYDPCPVGYQVPVRKALESFASVFPGSPGDTFMAYPTLDGGFIEFYYMGFRMRGTGLLVNAYQKVAPCFVWSAEVQDVTSAYRLDISKGTISTSYKSFGDLVCPVKERN